MLAEFVISLAVLAVELVLVAIGLLALGGVYALCWWLAVLVAGRRQRRRAGRRGGWLEFMPRTRV